MINIYVGNLSFNATESDLRSAFEAHGQVIRASVVTDRETGRSRGFGFVEMEDREAGLKAIEAINGKAIAGREVRVNEAQPREQRSGGGGGGFGGGGNRRRGGGGFGGGGFGGR
jgi:cold-inducible RNA-binding protein